MDTCCQVCQVDLHCYHKLCTYASSQIAFQWLYLVMLWHDLPSSLHMFSHIAFAQGWTREKINKECQRGKTENTHAQIYMRDTQSSFWLLIYNAIKYAIIVSISFTRQIRRCDAHDYSHFNTIMMNSDTLSTIQAIPRKLLTIICMYKASIATLMSIKSSPLRLSATGII